jgi:hypothetical protein
VFCKQKSDLAKSERIEDEGQQTYDVWPEVHAQKSRVKSSFVEAEIPTTSGLFLRSLFM